MSVRRFLKKLAFLVMSEGAYTFCVVLYWKWRLGRSRYYEPERELLPQYVSAGDLVVDVGANMGQYAWYMAKLVGSSGRVVAFEALPSTYELGRRIVQNKNVDWHNLALSDCEKTVSMAVHFDEYGMINTGLSAVSLGGERSDDVKVRASTLDLLLADRTKPVSFLKCDVEGHEVSVMRGGRIMLGRDMPVLLIETKSEHIPSLLSLLEPLGYEPFLCDSAGNLKPFEAQQTRENFNCFLIPPGRRNTGSSA